MLKLSNPFKKPLGPEIIVDHSTIRNADIYDWQVGYRRLAWLFRLSVFYSVSVTICLIISISSFQAILPLKEIRLALLRIDPADSRIFQIEPISTKVDGFKLLLEQKAQEFVLNLMGVDTVTQYERFTKAIDLAHGQLPSRIIKDFKESGLVDSIIQAGIIREIKITGVDHILSYEIGVYKLVVDYEQIDRRKGELVETKQLRAYLSMTTMPQTVGEAEKYENPLGIRITDMAVKFRGTQASINDKGQVK